MSINPSPTHTLQEARFRQKQIGKALGRFYAEVAGEQTPESFLALLEQADQMQPKPLPHNQLTRLSTMQTSSRSSSH